MCTPRHYSLTIRTDFPSTFTGTAEITLDVFAPVRSIALHTAAPLSLLSAVLLSATRRLLPKLTSYDTKRQLSTLEFSEDIIAGTATLGLRWEGSLDDGSRLGYYKIPYPSDRVNDEETGCSAVTQFEPSLARRAFPCFDHPAKKATFSVTLVSPVGVTSLSNSAETSRAKSDGRFPESEVLTQEFLAGNEGLLAASKTENSFIRVVGDWEIVTFAKTPLLSTYIVAWAVGKFSFISSFYTSPLSGKDIPLRMLGATPFQHIERGRGQLALDTLAKVMPIYEKLFDIAYPLPKLDILVCDAFDAGAMENMGLICGRASSLLYDSTRNGMSAKFDVVSTVAHEAAHCWFGNLVTLKWWDQLWLNEGFATLMAEVIIIDLIEPSWNATSNFIKFRRTAALALDALRNSHPVETECEDDSEETVSQTFDAISYEKGSAILKMFSNLIGEDAFVRGTSNYLKANLYGNTTGSDLWKAMSEVSGVDVAAVMGCWTTKVGFPVVTIEETDEGIKLRQNRFLSTGDPRPAEDETIWMIPLDVRIFGANAATQKILMSTRELVIPLSLRTDSLYTINSQTSGTFRVSYPASQLAKLALEATKDSCGISLADRLGILQDAILLAEAGNTRTSASLELMKKFAIQGEYLIWAEIVASLHRILDTWWEQPADVRDAMLAFGSSIFGPLVKRLGNRHLATDDTNTRLFRVLAISGAAAAEDPEILEYLKTSFLAMAAGQVDETSVDLAATIVSVAVKHGGDLEYDIALAIFNAPPTPAHTMAAIAGLTATRSPALIQQTAGMLMTGQVADQDVSYFLSGLAANPLSRRMVWQLAQAGFAGLEAKFQGSGALGHIVQASFQSLSSEKDANEVEAFFADKDTTSYSQPLQQGLETVRAKARWLSRDSADVASWLRSNGFLALA